MITIKEQEELLKLISRYIKKDIACWAFGGTAMMFYGYKDATKDIDIIFESEADRDVFIEALISLGYSKKTLHGIYADKKLKDKNTPLLYSRGDERFDLFVRKIFRTELSDQMKERFYARHDFAEGKSLIIYVLAKEDIILLKAVTERESDFDDILKICRAEKDIDWGLIINEAINQFRKGDKFLLLDLEENMQKLRKFVFIKEEYFKRMYGERG